MADDKQKDVLGYSQGARGTNPMRILLAVAAAAVLGIVAWKVSLRDQPQSSSAPMARDGVVLRADRVGSAKTAGATPVSPPSFSDGHFMPDSLALVIFIMKEYPDLASAKPDLDQEFARPLRANTANTAPATRASNAVFSDDGLHQARIIPATQPSGAVAAVIVDGVESDPANGPITDLQFSPDGKHYAFLAHTGSSGQVSLFVDGFDLKRPLPGKCHGLRYVSGTMLKIALASPDGKVRLMELKLVPRPPGSVRAPPPGLR